MQHLKIEFWKRYRDFRHALRYPDREAKLKGRISISIQ